MPNFTLKQIPDEVYVKLKKRAEAHRRSMNNEIIVCLEKMVNPEELDAIQILEKARELRREISGKMSSIEIQNAIRETRK
jgi:plasmid stability protein